ncbi:MAG: sigma-70 family RNA polymerase sigma factor [Verrucomicrobiota bacterium]|jgi:RNA polymerase primary sigma factor
MKLAFNMKQPEKKSGGRLTGEGLTNKRHPRNRLAAARVPGLANEGIAAEPSVKDPDAAPAASQESLSKDTLQLYLNEIGQVKLLTPEEELALAKRVKRGDKKARERMITANLRLVVKIARDYEGLGLPLLDLINEGNIGLMKGVERFDPKKGAKLSYYASWWIKQSMMRALANQSKTIRLPVHVVDKMAHIRRAEVKLREVFGHEPTDEEIADHLGLNTRRIQQYRDASKTPVSLDAPLGHDEPKPIAEVVADNNAAAPFDRLLKENDNGLVREALATLDTRESRILAMRFGLDNGTPKTLEEIASRFDVTRERIRQIQDGALKKMRSRIEERETPVLDDSSDS